MEMNPTVRARRVDAEVNLQGSLCRYNNCVIRHRTKNSGDADARECRRQESCEDEAAKPMACVCRLAKSNIFVTDHQLKRNTTSTPPYLAVYQRELLNEQTDDHLRYLSCPNSPLFKYPYKKQGYNHTLYNKLQRKARQRNSSETQYVTDKYTNNTDRDEKQRQVDTHPPPSIPPYTFEISCGRILAKQVNGLKCTPSSPTTGT
ncbi:hypothetical protein CSKR_103360 [Clonorchis sinensis]|uniref:Uncharacterized protein n=1 Tax=Clonorchis sinensis TaxID=79923 RepID=A0A8T1M8L3_CLOSI|nr:hypothetical protein CSKR_103360 [Clonorchis sinensis]